ncbi:iron transporter [Halomonas sp. GXIMD04776]|uniref:iron transporter n=1 Tax=Halomonas sp. GXIMD04776 TaxID=3415605 RepID=UPI003C83D79D
MKPLILAALPLSLSLSLVATQAQALEYPIGKPKLEHGMEIAAVYLQPVTMEPAGDLPAEKADVHLEADIHALEDNPNGFAPGAWIPYLDIDYTLIKQGSEEAIEGSFMPMMANDGTHYGANVKLDGPGKYHLTYTITSPQLKRHIDKETGVTPWYDTFQVNYDFVYAGTGKKGGY